MVPVLRSSALAISASPGKRVSESEIKTLPVAKAALALSAASADTLYLTLVGFFNRPETIPERQCGQVVGWDFSGNLPNVRVNWITLDPDHPGTIYLATNMAYSELMMVAWLVSDGTR